MLIFDRVPQRLSLPPPSQSGLKLFSSKRWWGLAFLTPRGMVCSLPPWAPKVYAICSAWKDQLPCAGMGSLHFSCLHQMPDLRPVMYPCLHLPIYSSGSPLGGDSVPPGDTGLSLETVLVVAGELLVPGGWRPGMLLKIPQYRGRPHQPKN